MSSAERVDHLDRGDRARRPGRGAADRRCLGLPDREPARPPARPLRPVVAGARRTAGAPRRGGEGGRDRRLRPEPPRAGGWPALADAAERAPRSGREAAENELSAALALVDPASLPVTLVAELADAEARVLLARRFHNDAVRDTLALRERPLVRMAAPRWNRRAANLFRDRRASRAAFRRAGRTRARRRASCCSTRHGCVLLFCGSDPATESRPRRAGGSPSAAPSNRGRRCPTPRCARSPRRPGLRVSAADLIGPRVAARRGVRVQRLGDPQRGDVLRLPHVAVRAVDQRPHRAGTPLPSTGTDGVTRRPSASWPTAARRCTRCSSAELLAEANAMAVDGSGEQVRRSAVHPLSCGSNRFGPATRLVQYLFGGDSCGYPHLEATGRSERSDRHRARQARHGRDAQGRRHHGRRHARAGPHRRGRRSRRGHGARARPRRHSRPGRRVADERPRHDRGHHLRGHHPGDGQGPHRSLRRGADPAEPRRRLRRRVRGAHPGRLRQPHRQVEVHRAVRVRCDQPG